MAVDGFVEKSIGFAVTETSEICIPAAVYSACVTEITLVKTREKIRTFMIFFIAMIL